MSDSVDSSNDGLSPKAIKGPAAAYQHDHPPIKNVNELVHDNRSLGQHVADRIATVVGGWPFIIIQSIVLVIWMASNVYLVMHFREKAFDPYPFILLNLVLSFQAAYTGPIVMMSQNRQNEKDRLSAQSDYECNLKAEEEIRVIMDHLTHQDEILVQQDAILAHQTGILNDMTRRMKVLQDQQEAFLPKLGGVSSATEAP